MHMKYSMTFPGLCKRLGITEDQGQDLINHSLDQVDFCKNISKKYKIELTLKQAAEVYETAPLDA